MPGSIKRFFAAFLSDWAAGMSGALSVPLAAAGVIWASADQKPFWWLLAFLCMFFSSYKIWQKLDIENYNLRKLIENNKFLARKVLQFIAAGAVAIPLAPQMLRWAHGRSTAPQA